MNIYFTWYNHNMHSSIQCSVTANNISNRLHVLNTNAFRVLCAAAKHVAVVVDVSRKWRVRPQILRENMLKKLKEKLGAYNSCAIS